jgi:endonuclease YncB( thermonuclease family)
MPIVFLFLSLFAVAEVPVIEMDSAKAMYIVDGDSISLSMRIKGIDTPEKSQKCRKVVGKIVNCGLIAKEYLNTLLRYLPGKLVIIPEGFGYYGRVLVSVHKGNVNVGKMMVEKGMAHAYGARYQKEQALARQHKVGFWGYEKPPLEPKKWRKRYLKKFKP